MQAPLKSKGAAKLVNINDVPQSCFQHIHTSHVSFSGHILNDFLITGSKQPITWMVDDKADCRTKCPSAELAEKCPCTLGWTQR